MPDRVRLSTASPALHLEIVGWGRAFMCTHLGYLFMVNPTMANDLPMLGSLIRVLPLHGWGYICLLCGMLRMLGLIVNRAFARPGYLRFISITAAGATCFIWLQLTLSYMAATVETPGLAILPYLLMLDVYCVWQEVMTHSKKQGPQRNAIRGHVHRVAGLGAVRR